MIPVRTNIKRTALIALAALAATACAASESTGGGGYWPGAYDPMGQPATYAAPVFHAANAADHPGACLDSGCHDAEIGFAPKMAWGGVVYQADGKTRANNVQVGVVSGTYRSFVYSRRDGLYWSELSSDSVVWDTAADIRIRNANGEKLKLPEHGRRANCDECHREGSTGSDKAELLKTN